MQSSYLPTQPNNSCHKVLPRPPGPAIKKASRPLPKIPGCGSSREWKGSSTFALDNAAWTPLLSLERLSAVRVGGYERRFYAAKAECSAGILPAPERCRQDGGATMKTNPVRRSQEPSTDGPTDSPLYSGRAALGFSTIRAIWAFARGNGGSLARVARCRPSVRTRRMFARTTCARLFATREETGATK
jgi:hypothetical protein